MAIQLFNKINYACSLQMLIRHIFIETLSGKGI